jgi:NADH:ubiquinone oxidoreductase subunit 5 (subunit L)/multisubunit Na+/H+ antiporter MnhA subunit
MDWINENIIARGARALGTGLWKGGDQAIIDGVFVNGSVEAGRQVRRRGALGAVRLHLSLRLRDAARHLRADDVLRQLADSTLALK